MPPGLELFFYAYPGLRRVAPSPPGYYLSPAQARVLEFRGLRPPNFHKIKNRKLKIQNQTSNLPNCFTMSYKKARFSAGF
jgi:hypothetical protein